MPCDEALKQPLIWAQSTAEELWYAIARCVFENVPRDRDETVSTFDIAIGPGAAARLGLDAATLRAVNARIIHCSISGYGTQGPMRDGKGYDIILQAFSGMLSITGESEGGPVRIPFSLIDQGTGMHALAGILAALHGRDVTGQGAAIEVSLFDTAIGFLSYMLRNFWERGTEPKRYGVGHESLCPNEAFDTADRPLILGVANDSMWRAFCRLTGLDT